MRRRISTIIVLVAWFFATGSQWDVAQLVAWGNMFAGHVREMTVGAAVEKTFSGEMCPICRAVRRGKQEQERSGDKTPEAKVPGKALDLYPLAGATQALPPTVEAQRFFSTETPMFSHGRAAPPLPPPRAAA